MKRIKKFISRKHNKPRNLLPEKTTQLLNAFRDTVNEQTTLKDLDTEMLRNILSLPKELFALSIFAATYAILKARNYPIEPRPPDELIRNWNYVIAAFLRLEWQRRNNLVFNFLSADRPLVENIDLDPMADPQIEYNVEHPEYKKTQSNLLLMMRRASSKMPTLTKVARG